MSFVADDLSAWLIGLLADAGRKKLTAWVLGDEQERALRQAAAAAVHLVASELRPEGGQRVDELAMVVDQVFVISLPDEPSGARATLLEVMRSGIARQVAVLDDAGLTGVGQSSAQILELSATVVAERLTGHLLREIKVRGSRGGPLEPLAAQLNHDETHLQGQHLERMLEGLARQLTAIGQPAVLEVRYSLPPDTLAFTGRQQELERISAMVSDATKTGGLFAIYAIDGMPGVGKTALAVHAAHLLRHRFPDRQLFIDLHAHTPDRDPVAPEAALAELLIASGVDARYLPDSLENRAALWRDRMAGQRALLVLDNAASAAQLAPLLPGGEASLVLVTSRRHLGDLPAGAVSLRLETLPPDEAVAMFMRLAPRAATTAPEGTVAGLMRLVGYLPLAISLLARVYARHATWTITDLAAETSASVLTLTAEQDTVGAAIDVSWRHLRSGQQQFLRRVGLHPGTTVDAYSAAAVAGVTLQEAADYMDALHGEGLLTEVAHRRYGMHDLILRYVRDRASADPAADRSQALGRLLDYYQHAAAVAESLLARQSSANTTRATLSAGTEAVPGLGNSTQALAWGRAERANLLACLDYATGTGQHARVVALTGSMAALLRRDGPWTDAITRHTAAVGAARKLADRSEEARALSNLAAVRWLTDDFRGAACALNEALGIYRDIGDRLGQANALNDIGETQRLNDDFQGAARSLNEALGIYRDIGDRLGQANALNALGDVQCLTGDYPRAVQARGEALSLYRDLGDSLGEANALTDLGSVLRQIGDYQGATRAQQEALGIYRDIGDLRGEANALNYLGAARRQVGDYSAAAQALKDALSIYRIIGNRNGQANALNHLGAVRRQIGDYPEAYRALENALDIYRTIGNRLGAANALANLGAVRRDAGNYPEAVHALEDALAIYRDIGNRGGEVTAINEMGTVHLADGDLGIAEECHRRALDLAREIGSAWDEAHALAGLGRCARAASRTADAQFNLRQAHEIFQRIGTADADDIAAELSLNPPTF